MKPEFIIKTASLSSAAIIVAAFVFFTGCTATAPPPAPTGSHTEVYEEGVPGGIIVNTVEVLAKVIAIDPVSRRVMLLKPDEKEITVKVGPAAVNFDQIRIGDMVKVKLTDELMVFLDTDGADLPDGKGQIVALAPKGASPGGVMAETTQITGTIVAIDPAGRTVTLEFEDTSLKTFPVRDDIDLNGHKPGEKVVFLITEMIAVSVEKQ